MKKNKLFPIILVSLSCILFVIAIVLVLNTNYFSFNNATNNKETNNSQLKEENVNSDNKVDNQVEENKQENNVNKNETIKEETPNTNNNKNETIKEEIPNNNDNPTTNQNNNVTPQETPTVKEEDNTSNDEKVEESTKSEETIIGYFTVEDNNITSDVNQDNKTFREKAKNAFVTVVDFIFYDKEIKGYTFKGLTNSAKLKIISIALSIDNKIDKFFPDYKDVIKDKYNNIKGKLAVKYLEFTSSLCEKVGKDTCNEAKENFNTMKENFSITWQLIKELASSGSAKVKEFYESWRDSE